MIRYAQTTDLGAILDIYNDAILNTTSVYDYKPHTIEDRLSWYEKKVSDGFPVLVSEENKDVIGFATFGPFRAWPAYKYTVEHSVYVHKDHRGKRVGTRLMIELIKIANEREYVTMVAGIDSSNEGSRVMHENLGFTNCGTIKKAGYKFGKWLNLTFYQCELRGPTTPKEE
ncbi:MAG: N-acetyltransferase [Chloroflexi bacterium]|nr:N-acetyltransferase [Chloroflexota bacterium]